MHQQNSEERSEWLSALPFSVGNAYYYKTADMLARFVTVLLLFADVNISETKTVAEGIAHLQFSLFCWMTA